MDNQGGKRHYEATLYFIVACVAIALLYVQVIRVSAPVEQARVQYTLSNLRAAVQLAELAAIAAGDPGRVSRLDRTNPFELMNTPSPGYAGTLPPIEQTRPGRFYFDRVNGELVYRVPGTGTNMFRRFQLRYTPADSQGAGPGRLRLTELDQGPAP